MWRNINGKWDSVYVASLTSRNVSCKLRLFESFTKCPTNDTLFDRENHVIRPIPYGEKLREFNFELGHIFLKLDTASSLSILDDLVYLSIEEHEWVFNNCRANTEELREILRKENKEY